MQIKTSLSALRKKALKTATYAATTPLTATPKAQTTRNMWGDLKNAVAGIFGKGDRFHERAADVKNRSWDKSRGNFISSHYAATGKLTLQLADDVLTEGSLQMLEAIDNSEIGELDPSSKGIQSGFTDGAFKHRAAKKECDKLLDLRKRVEANGGHLKVERSPDGFSRMLKISIDTRNKSIEDVQKELMVVLKAVGLDSEMVAKSLAKELIHERDTRDMNASYDMSHSESAPLSPEKQQKKSTVDDKECLKVLDDLDSTLDKKELEVDKQLKSSEAQEVSDQEFSDVLEDLDFSLSGEVAARPSLVAGDLASAQTQFLENSTSQEASIENSAGVTTEQKKSAVDVEAEIREAIDGLGGVTHDSSSSPMAGQEVRVTPATAQAARDSGSKIRGM